MLLTYSPNNLSSAALSSTLLSSSMEALLCRVHFSLEFLCTCRGTTLQNTLLSHSTETLLCGVHLTKDSLCVCKSIICGEHCYFTHEDTTLQSTLLLYSIETLLCRLNFRCDSLYAWGGTALQNTLISHSTPLICRPLIG